MAKQRIEEITLLRAMAFMAITMQHCIAEYIYRSDILQPDSIMLAMLFHYTRFGTPTFVFLSGVILFYNYAGTAIRYGSYVKRRFVDIFVPFLCWTLVYWLSVSLFSGQSLTDADAWRTLAGQLLRPTYGYHLWFILMIFQFYLLLPIFLRIAEPLKRFATLRPERAVTRTVWILAIAAAAYAGLLWLSYYKAGVIASWGEPWAWLMEHRSKWFVFYFFYFMLGAVCAYGLARFRELAVSWLALSGLLFIGCYVWVGYELLGLSMDSMKLGLSTYLRPAIFVLIVTQLAAAYALSVLLDRYGGWFKRFMLTIGRHSFGGFLAHAFVLMLAANVTRPLQLAGYHLPVAVATFLVVAAGSIGLARLIGMLPLGHWLVGAQGRRDRAARLAQAQAQPKHPTNQQGSQASRGM
jgi:surface polysaccharide O-acyltransferase-like enzyme